MRITRFYEMSGLKLRSEIEIPGAISVPYHAGVAGPDVEIKVTSAPLSIENASFRNDDCEIGARDFLFRPKPGLGFRVRNGTQITISRKPDVADRDIQLFLVGSAWGVLCHQRGLLPLHASAVVVEGRAIAIAAPSGTGKSTLTAGLTSLGYPLLADDVCVVDLAASKQPMAYPLPAKGIKLWQDAAEMLGLGLGRLVDESAARRKYYVDVPRYEGRGPVPLAALYVLVDSREEEFEIEPLRGGSLLTTLVANIYRIEWINFVGNNATLFQQVGKLCGSLNGFCFRRPRDLSKLEHSLAHIERHMRTSREVGPK